MMPMKFIRILHYLVDLVPICLAYVSSGGLQWSLPHIGHMPIYYTHVETCMHLDPTMVVK